MPVDIVELLRSLPTADVLAGEEREAERRAAAHEAGRDARRAARVATAQRFEIETQRARDVVLNVVEQAMADRADELYHERNGPLAQYRRARRRQIHQSAHDALLEEERREDEAELEAQFPRSRGQLSYEGEIALAEAIAGVEDVEGGRERGEAAPRARVRRRHARSSQNHAHAHGGHRLRRNSFERPQEEAGENFPGHAQFFRQQEELMRLWEEMAAQEREERQE